MKNLSRLLTASLVLASALTTTLPASARTTDSTATITLAAPSPVTDFILDGVFWTCQGTTCSVDYAPSMPPLRTCQRVVAITGPATAFTLHGQALSPDSLTQCNTRAKS